MPIPQEPIVFLKAANTVVGPYDDLRIPRGSEKTDWEVELGVVIGKEARYLPSPEAAHSHIAGYCLTHDVSERAFQLERGVQWTKGKSCDTQTARAVVGDARRNIKCGYAFLETLGQSQGTDRPIGRFFG